MVTRRSTLVRPPLDARRNKSASSGPMRRTARPIESSVRLAARHGSPGPRVSSVAREAAGTWTVTVTLSPRRTVARSTHRRTGVRVSASVRSGCQNAAARPAAGAEATNSAAPTAAAPSPAATPRRVPRASARRIRGAARSTTAAARASASASKAALAPPVAQVRLIGIVYDQPVTQKNAEPLGREAVVLVNLRDPLRELIRYVIDRVRQRDFNEGVVGKHARDLAPERLVHPIVVVGMEETALLEVAAQDRHLLVGEAHVAVPRHIEVRDVPEAGARQRHDPFPLVHGEAGALADRAEQVHEFRGTRVPVAAAIVVEAADGERGGGP